MDRRQYFGTDGVRGAVGSDRMSPYFVVKLARAAGRFLAEKLEREGSPSTEGSLAVILGKDTRISGYGLESAMVAGFASVGVSALQTGPLPTPGVAYLTRAFRLPMGVVISASHNPYGDNGIKFFGEDGRKLSDAEELRIEQLIDVEDGKPDAAAARWGRARRIVGAQDRYVEFCKSAFPNSMSLKGLKIVVDAANGAGWDVAGKVFRELGADVSLLGCEPNGYNINDGVGAIHPENLRAAVLAQSADYGVAIDGDGDRCLMADDEGNLYDGDDLLYVIARGKLQDQDGLRSLGGVVGTVMCNMGLQTAFSRLGVPFARSGVGDKLVLDLMLQKGWRLGGEGSGHVIVLDKHNTGDGCIAALQALQAERVLGKKLKEIAAEWSRIPASQGSFRLADAPNWEFRVKDETEKLRKELGDSGRVLVRPSGTEPIVRLLVEAQEMETARRGVERLRLAALAGD